MNQPAKLVCSFVLTLVVTAFAADPCQPAHKLAGIPHDSGFADGHDPYNSLGCASDSLPAGTPVLSAVLDE